ncbi:MAG: GNAT family N-acetyltransferase [Eubacteriaceae bacterium]|nr:GNAT family N-acetyltransferase [Eubacteriaceae bacterium]
MKIVKCGRADISRLAKLNKQLIDDEGSSNTMGIDQLEKRMAGFLAGNYDAYFFVEDYEVVGYALVDKSAEPLYLRHFMIERGFRRKHLGTEAFNLLMDYLRCDKLDVEVLSGNAAGVGFWESLGFREVSRYLRLNRRGVKTNNGNGH